MTLCAPLPVSAPANAQAAQAAVKVTILGPAQRDLEELAGWLRRERPDVAERVLEALLDGLEQLAALPHSGPPAQSALLAARGYRCLVRADDVTFYKVTGARLYVHRVLHHSRDWADLV